MQILIILFFIIIGTVLGVEKNKEVNYEDLKYFEVIDPISFRIKSVSIIEKYRTVYFCEMGHPSRIGKKIKEKFIIVRLPCLSIKNISPERQAEGKLYLQSYLTNILKKNLLYHILEFQRGPDKNGVYLYRLKFHSNFVDNKYEYEKDGKIVLIENDDLLFSTLIAKGYAERFETCFSCAPRPFQGKIPNSNIPFLKHYKKWKGPIDNNACSLGELDDKHPNWDYTKKLCGDHVPIASDEKYDWVIPKGMFKRGVFGED
jgi:hypothetical protein